MPPIGDCAAKKYTHALLHLAPWKQLKTLVNALKARMFFYRGDYMGTYLCAEGVTGDKL